MKELYTPGTANYPRLKTDVLFVDYNNKYSYKGVVDDAVKFVCEHQLMDAELWERFAEQFREDSDYDAGWRGEYWGKMMRGAAFVYSYTGSQQLYDILKKTVLDMMNCADENGRISSYAISHEFDGWDIWCRKYVLLGMQYFLEVCKEEDLKNSIIASMRSQMDYIIRKIGSEEGKIPITAATRHWRGLNSSSLLEPVVRLYNITGDKRYLDFATYIVDCGGTDVENLFELAYQDEMYPYQYPVTKAYEMMSCFEGLLEYYRVTGVEKYKTAVINFADKILESDFTIVGSCGCTHEYFDHSTVRQANTTNGDTAQETCVTVTLMKFLYQLSLVTGDTKYIDAFELAFYNAYLGSFNTELVIEPDILNNHSDKVIAPLPFDSYSPLTAGTRGNGIGGLKFMTDNHYYGCCACIGAAGVGLVPKLQFMTTHGGFALNMFICGSVETTAPDGKKAVFTIDTDYPKSGSIKVTVEADGEFELCVRNPHWSKTTEVMVNGETVPVNEGYITINRNWSTGDVVEIDLDMRVEVIKPIPYGSQIIINKVIWGKNYMVPVFDREDPIAHKHVALRRGPVILSQDNRLGYSVDEPVDIITDDSLAEVVIPCEDTVPFVHIIEAQVTLANGKTMTVVDYASAGKTMTDESKMAAWILTK